MSTTVRPLSTFPLLSKCAHTSRKDSWNWADVTKATSDADVQNLNDKFYNLWLQIGRKLACKPNLVSFESINEPPATTADHGARINTLNDLFLKALADSGGFNARRVVNLVGGGMDATKTTQWFKAPASIKNPWVLHYHVYSPYDFIFSAWGKTIWGSDADKAAMRNEMAIVRGNFTDVPLVIGEFDASPLNTEPAARWKWTDQFVRTAAELNTAVVIWDNGLDHLDRNAHAWRDPTSLAILNTAVKGTKNSLPDSTTDASATTQSSSAYVWNKVGTAPADQTLPWLFNGNTLQSVKTISGTTLAANTDYTASASAITFKAAFLSKYLSATAAPGSKANLTLAFSAGATSQVELVQWDVPVVTAASSKAIAGADLKIPITFKGLKTVAAVKALRSDGVYLFDDWTQYLGPLQQAHIVSRHSRLQLGTHGLLGSGNGRARTNIEDRLSTGSGTLTAATLFYLLLRFRLSFPLARRRRSPSSFTPGFLATTSLIL